MSFGKTNTSPADLSVTSLQAEDVATHQEDVPIPDGAGRNRTALRWLRQATHRRKKEAKQTGGKKSGGGGKGGSEAAKTYDHFGTVAGAFAIGPVFGIRAVLHDGKTLWEGTANFGSADVLDLTSSIDPLWLYDSTSYLRLYRGSETQLEDPALTDEPAYRGWAVLVGHGLLFGQGKDNAPNLEVDWVRLPEVSTDLVPTASNLFDADEQINPVAALAEILAAPNRLGLPLSAFATASWQTGATWAADTGRRAVTFCSPLWDSQRDVRAQVAELLAMFDGGLRRDAQGRLELVLLRLGEPAGGDAPLLDARHWRTVPELPGKGADSVPTLMVCTYRDAARGFKQADEAVPAPLHHLLRGGLIEAARLGLPHVRRRTQAARLGAVALARAYRPAAEVTLELPTEVARRTDGQTPLLPGDVVRVDFDPTPGGAGLAVKAIVQAREEDMSGAVRLRVQTDAAPPPVAYAPDWTGLGEDAEPVEPLAHGLALPLPPGGWGWPPTVGLVATRPVADIDGFDVLFDRDPGAGLFPRLGTQPGFGVRLTLQGAWDGASLLTSVGSSATILQATLTDGLNSPDAYLAGRLPASELEARDNVLLLVLANVAAGAVVVTGGRPELEFCAIVSRAAVAADTHRYTVLRGRLGLGARAWTTSAVAWLIPFESLVPWGHADLPALVASEGTGYFRLRPLAPPRPNEETALLELPCIFPSAYADWPKLTWTTPSGSSGTTDTAGAITVTGTATDSGADLVGLRLDWWELATPGVVTTALDEAFARTASRPWSVPLVLPGHVTDYRTFVVRLEARDEQGNRTSDARQIVRTPTGTPSGLLPPTLDPPSDEFAGSLVITVSRTGAATEIHYARDYAWSEPPTSGWTVATTNPTAITMPRSGRLYVRASTGSLHSAWVYGDYYEFSDGGSSLEP